VKAAPQAVSQLAARLAFRKAGRLSVGRDQLLSLLEITLEPLVLVLSLWGIAIVVEGHLRAPHLVLALVVVAARGPTRAPGFSGIPPARAATATYFFQLPSWPRFPSPTPTLS
jgi:hypothetical protein